MFCDDQIRNDEKCIIVDEMADNLIIRFIYQKEGEMSPPSER